MSWWCRTLVRKTSFCWGNGRCEAFDSNYCDKQLKNNLKFRPLWFYPWLFPTVSKWQWIRKMKHNVLLCMTKSACFFCFSSSCLLITRSNFSPSPDGISRGVVTFAKYPIWKPQICLVWIRDEQNMDGSGQKDGEKNCCCLTALLSWWNKRAEGFVLRHKLAAASTSKIPTSFKNRLLNTKLVCVAFLIFLICIFFFLRLKPYFLFSLRFRSMAGDWHQGEAQRVQGVLVQITRWHLCQRQSDRVWWGAVLEQPHKGQVRT